MSEADERLPRGPKGEPGERGLSRRASWAVVVLFAISAAGIVGNLLWTAHEISASNHKFCQVITATTAVPVPRPADPSANPSRETSYEWYVRFVDLGRSLGCGP